MQAQTPELVANINLAGSSDPMNLTVIGNYIYFSADDGVSGDELWRSDGTTLGTEMVSDIHPSDGSQPTYFTELNGTVYFSADNGVGGRELWRTQGSSLNTWQVKDINNPGGSYPSRFTRYNAEIVFKARDNSTGYELWTTDGTVGGTERILDIFAGTPNSNPEGFIELNGTLYFSADDGTNGRELWKTDGTTGGTQMVANIYTGGSSSPSDLIIFNNRLFFRALSAANGYELWSSDGTSVGTTLVKDIFISGNASPIPLSVLGNKLIFSADDGVNGRELWSTDGTTAGTNLLKDIKVGPNSGVHYFTNTMTVEVIDNILYFKADDGINGVELWRTDGTTSGTYMVKDLNPEAGDGMSDFIVSFLTKANGMLYFTANDGVNGFELWRSDGTEYGTFMIGDINLGASSLPYGLCLLNNALYFAADDGVNGYELWKVDVAVGVEEQTSHNFELNVFPVPVADILSIQLESQSTDQLITRVVNIQGVELLNETSASVSGTIQKTINVSYLPTGMYFLEIHQGELKATISFTKIVK